MERQEILDAIGRQPKVSVLIVGGGINGAGVFRDLALQGVDMLLVDKSDFCAACSAASGRVIHGGVRYLENGEFRLVREALLERNRLLVNAPHYVKPLPATIPMYGWFSGIFYAFKQFLHLKSKPGDRGALIIKAGLIMYDLFAGNQQILPHHRFEFRGAARAKRPLLNPRILCTATYYDAKLTYAERLCLELVLDGEAASPNAHALNYVRVSGASGDTVTLKDEVTGATVDVQPGIVVNASGAWIDFTNRAMQRPTQFIGGTKGSHLVVDHQELWDATQGQMLHFVNSDGRITIFYPIEDKVLIGTTDIPVTDPEQANWDEEETEYLLHAVNVVFPSIRLDRSNIVFRFCGVRPLPSSDAFVPGQISRDHSSPLVPPDNGIGFPIYSLVGGKWTTFRAFSEQVTDQLLPTLGRTRTTDTKNLPIGGGKGYPLTETERKQWVADFQLKSGLPAERIDALLERYGTRAAAVIAFMQAGDDHPLQHAAGYTVREVQFMAAQDKLVHLDDLILRRTLLGFLGRVNRAILDELAAVVAPVLGWSETRAQREVERTIQLLEHRHGVNFETQIEPA